MDLTGCSWHWIITGKLADEEQELVDGWKEYVTQHMRKLDRNRLREESLHDSSSEGDSTSTEEGDIYPLKRRRDNGDTHFVNAKRCKTG